MKEVVDAGTHALVPYVKELESELKALHSTLRQREASIAELQASEAKLKKDMEAERSQVFASSDLIFREREREEERSDEEEELERGWCRRRDCAFRTQCDFLEHQREQQRGGHQTERYNARIEAFQKVPWQLDPSKIWYLFPEVYACPTMQRAGALYDGGKWTCRLHLVKPPCVIYSFGTWDDVSFELAVDHLGCELHAFEPDPRPIAKIKPIFDRHPHWHLHQLALAPVDDPSRGLRSLGSLMAELGHTSLDFLKIDIEGPEFECLTPLRHAANITIHELIVEVHNPTLEGMLGMVRALDSLGLQTFAREINTLASGVTDATGGRSCCAEYAFVRVPYLARCPKLLASGGGAGFPCQSHDGSTAGLGRTEC